MDGDQGLWLLAALRKTCCHPTTRCHQKRGQPASRLDPTVSLVAILGVWTLLSGEGVQESHLDTQAHGAHLPVSTFQEH